MDPTVGEAINESDEPSRLLDVGQWILLARLLIEDAEREPDRVLARNLRIESGRCLEEAVKFFDDAENDLPPAGAFFCDASRQRFRQAPEQFSRRRLIEMRARLPNPYVGGNRETERNRQTGDTR